MQGRTLEKYVWSVSFIFCALILTANDARASGLESVAAHSQNPWVYIIGLAVTFTGAKMFGHSGTQF